jgi:hypothetical protein
MPHASIGSSRDSFEAKVAESTELGSTNLEAGRMGNTEGADALTSVFESLEGSWMLERNLNSANASEPSG